MPPRKDRTTAACIENMAKFGHVLPEIQAVLVAGRHTHPQQFTALTKIDRVKLDECQHQRALFKFIFPNNYPHRWQVR